MTKLTDFSFLLFYIFIAALPVTIRYIYGFFKYKNSSYKNFTNKNYLNVLFDKGAYGEFLIFRVLESINPYAKVLTNLYIPREDNSLTEVDLVMIDQTGIYVFESKNYSGWIFGSEQNKYWTQTFKNKHKEKFFNPILQNRVHINSLQYITQIFDDDIFYSYIIFSKRCELKKISLFSDNVTVLKRNELKKALRRRMNSLKPNLSLQDVDDLYNVLLNYCNVDREISALHIKEINRKYN